MTTESPESRAPRWRELMQRAGLGAERAFETVRDRFDARFRTDRPVQIVGYRGHANDTLATVSARVLAWSGRPDNDPDSLWERLQDSYRRFETDEVGNEPVRLAFDDETHVSRSDAEGYVHFTFAPPAASEGSFDVTLSLPDRPDEAAIRVEIVRPAPSARFGIISDIDDTVLVTEATSVVRMMRLTLLESSASRIAFDGAAAFYRALAVDRNPLFYVSSSPWNLYEFLEDFLALNDFPAGPLFLRDFGIERERLIAGGHGDHKLAAIRGVLSRHPELPFVLIGDSGQRDPEIYREIVEADPTRISVVYIRDVTDAARDTEVLAHRDALAALGVPMLLVPDTAEAARHAASLGLIAAGALADIDTQTQRDRAPHPAADEPASEA